LRHAPALQARLKRGLARRGEVRGAWPSLQTGNLLLLFGTQKLMTPETNRTE
jgi:hypothetical protein